jgi:hypothetical protein
MVGIVVLVIEIQVMVCFISSSLSNSFEFINYNSSSFSHRVVEIAPLLIFLVKLKPLIGMITYKTTVL